MNCFSLTISMLLLSAGIINALPTKDSTQVLEDMMKDCIKEINKDPSINFSYGGKYFEAEMQHCYGDSTFRKKILDFYDTVMQKSDNYRTKRWAIEAELLLGDVTDKKEMILPKVHQILINDLKYKFIEVRLWSADMLYNLGYKDDAYPIYRDILVRSDINQWLDSEYRFQFEQEIDWNLKRISDLKNISPKNNLEKLEREGKIKQKEGEIERVKRKVVNIESIKMDAVKNIIHKLITYNNDETRTLVRKAILENSYDSAVIYNPDKIVNRAKGKIVGRGKGGHNYIKDIENFIGKK